MAKTIEITFTGTDKGLERTLHSVESSIKRFGGTVQTFSTVLRKVNADEEKLTKAMLAEKFTMQEVQDELLRLKTQKEAVTTATVKMAKSARVSKKSEEDLVEVLTHHGNTLDKMVKKEERWQESQRHSITSAIKYSALYGGVAAALYKVSEAMGSIITTGTEMQATEAVFLSTFGSMEQVRKEFQFLDEVADKYAMNIGTLRTQYRNFAASAVLTGEDLGTVREIFTNMTKAARGLHLSNDDLQGSFRAIQQIFSKGKVQAEELRNQLGERLPGAMAIMAKAVGVSTETLNKMMEQGQLTSDVMADFSQKYADSITDAGLLKSLSTLQADTARAGTEWNRFAGVIFKRVEPALRTITQAFTTSTKAAREFSSSDYFSLLVTGAKLLAVVLSMRLVSALYTTSTKFVSGKAKALGLARGFGVAAVSANALTLASSGLKAIFALLGGPVGMITLAGIAAYSYRKEIGVAIGVVSELWKLEKEHKKQLDAITKATYNATGAASSHNTELAKTGKLLIASAKAKLAALNQAANEAKGAMLNAIEKNKNAGGHRGRFLKRGGIHREEYRLAEKAYESQRKHIEALTEALKKRDREIQLGAYLQKDATAGEAIAIRFHKAETKVIKALEAEHTKLLGKKKKGAEESKRNAIELFKESLAYKKLSPPMRQVALELVKENEALRASKKPKKDNIKLTGAEGEAAKALALIKDEEAKAGIALKLGVVKLNEVRSAGVTTLGKVTQATVDSKVALYQLSLEKKKVTGASLKHLVAQRKELLTTEALTKANEKHVVAQEKEVKSSAKLAKKEATAAEKRLKASEKLLKASQKHDKAVQKVKSGLQQKLLVLQGNETAAAKLGVATANLTKKEGKQVLALRLAIIEEKKKLKEAGKREKAAKAEIKLQKKLVRERISASKKLVREKKKEEAQRKRIIKQKEKQIKKEKKLVKAKQDAAKKYQEVFEREETALLRKIALVGKDEKAAYALGVATKKLTKKDKEHLTQLNDTLLAMKANLKKKKELERVRKEALKVLEKENKKHAELKNKLAGTTKAVKGLTDEEQKAYELRVKDNKALETAIKQKDAYDKKIKELNKSINAQKFALTHTKKEIVLYNEAVKYGSKIRADEIIQKEKDLKALNLENKAYGALTKAVDSFISGASRDWGSLREAILAPIMVKLGFDGSAVESGVAKVAKIATQQLSNLLSGGKFSAGKIGAGVMKAFTPSKGSGMLGGALTGASAGGGFTALLGGNKKSQQFAQLGGALGSLAGPLGSAIGSAIGGIVGQLVGGKRRVKATFGGAKSAGSGWYNTKRNTTKTPFYYKTEKGKGFGSFGVRGGSTGVSSSLGRYNKEEIPAIKKFLAGMKKVEGSLAAALPKEVVAHITEGLQDFETKGRDLQKITQERLTAIFTLLPAELRKLTGIPTTIEGLTVGIASLTTAGKVAIPALASVTSMTGDITNKNLATVLSLQALATAQSGSKVTTEALATSVITFSSNFAAANSKTVTASALVVTEITKLNKELGLGKNAAILTTEQVNNFTKGLDLNTKAGKEGLLTILKYQDSILAVNAIMSKLTPVVSKLNLGLGKTAGAIAKNLTELSGMAGGTDKLTASLQTYMDVTYNEEEKLALVRSQAALSIDSYNQKLLASGKAAITNAEQYRKHIETIDLNTEAGKKQLLEALELANAFGTMEKSNMSLTEALKKVPQRMKNFTTAMKKGADKNVAALKAMAKATKLATPKFKEAKKGLDKLGLSAKAVGKAIKGAIGTIEGSLSQATSLLTSAKDEAKKITAAASREAKNIVDKTNASLEASLKDLADSQKTTAKETKQMRKEAADHNSQLVKQLDEQLFSSTQTNNFNLGWE